MSLDHTLCRSAAHEHWRNEFELQALADAPFDVATFIFGFKFAVGAH